MTLDSTGIGKGFLSVENLFGNAFYSSWKRNQERMILAWKQEIFTGQKLIHKL